jgi:hypothetical protein
VADADADAELDVGSARSPGRRGTSSPPAQLPQRGDRSGHREGQAEKLKRVLGAIERGEFNVRLDTIVKIAAALEISAAALLERARL